MVWRTPGADGGRDIEASYTLTDASGAETNQRWYAECKRYSSSIDWPTVFQKLAYANNHKADYLLMISTSNPSPVCETEISRWNSDNHLQIRFWRGYQLASRLRTHVNVATRYGLSESPSAAVSLQSISLHGLKFSQAAEASYIAQHPAETALHAASAIANLVFQRTQDIERYQRAAFILTPWHSIPDWVVPRSKILMPFDAAGIEAYIGTLRHVTAAAALSLSEYDGWVHVDAQNSRLPISGSAASTLTEIALWSEIEQVITSPSSVMIRSRDPQ